MDEFAKDLSSVAGRIPFVEVANLVEKLNGITGKGQKDLRHKYFRSLLTRWTDHFEKQYGFLPYADGPETFFPCLRLLLPSFDERPTYSIQEATLTRLFRDVLGLASDSATIQKLNHWKRFVCQRTDAVDYAGVAAVALHPHTRREGQLSVEDVNTCLDILAEANSFTGETKKDKIKDSLGTILRRSDPFELKWIIRVILKDLKLGMSRDLLLDAFHRDARRLYGVTARLSTVCRRLCDTSVPVQQFGISLMKPILPMRAKIWDSDSVSNVLKETSLIAEIKYDGERFHIHKNGDEFRCFSRPGNDYSDILGHSANEGTLIPFIASLFRRDADNFIIDGELCPYFVKSRSLGSKADCNWIKNLRETSGCHVCFAAFDLIYLNDESLVNRPLRDRLNLLNSLFTPLEGRLTQAIRKEVTSVDECANFLNEIANVEEGLIIKDPRSIYRPKIQSNDWWKLKPEFIGNLSEQLDLLILGGYRGLGNKMASNFLLGAAEINEGGNPTRFRSICRIAVGFKRQELESMILRLQAYFTMWEDSAPPDFVVLNDGRAHKPDFWISPQHSCVLQIRAAQLVRCGSFAAGYTLRFPHVARIRHDKAWCDTTNMFEISRIALERSKRLGAEGVTEADLDQATKRKVLRTTNRVHLPAHARPLGSHDVQIKATVFNNKQFYVVEESGSYKRHDIERTIVENGGSCVVHPTPRTFCILSSILCIKIRNLLKISPIDVVHPMWILRCTEGPALFPWNADEMVYAKPRTAKLLSITFDDYGDSCVDDIDVVRMKKLFCSVERKMKTAPPLSTSEMDQFAYEYFGSVAEVSLFKGFRFFIVASSKPTCPLSKSCEEYVLSFGGTISSVLDATVTHVVVIRDQRNVDAELRKISDARNVKFQVVDFSWIFDCVKEGHLQEERKYCSRMGFSRPPALIPLFS